ncbi:class II D-tagatose-bisphosphate aldolase, non-catalytic subunit, partial [Rhizobium leguminosarum]|uniref:class II D-tagatose-bisphosphate aldolase non-catalytic subunit n=1 Tax=Rhizobium leguminosarum TaxID=384 RepID=UPI003F9B4CBF
LAAIIEDYILIAELDAGFRKIHLDASMGCRGEPVALEDENTAHRAARLGAVAEASAKKSGGDQALTTIEPTAAAAALKTIEVHRRIFA